MISKGQGSVGAMSSQTVAMDQRKRGVNRSQEPGARENHGSVESRSQSAQAMSQRGHKSMGDMGQQEPSARRSQQYVVGQRLKDDGVADALPPAPIRQGKPCLGQSYRVTTKPSRKHLVTTVSIKDRDKSVTIIIG